MRDLLSRKTPQDTPGLVIAFNVVVMVLLAAVIGNLLFETWQPLTPRLALYGLASGFFVALAHYFVFMAFRLTTARAVAPFYYTFTLCAVLFGAIFFEEVPNVIAIAGIALIVACGLGVLALENRKDVHS
jgi:drug/metabolite transporter (DMT)-like permease